MKMTTVHGSGELDIYEPEYVAEDTTIFYPYDFEARDNWDVTITITAPEGYIADKESETLTIPPQAIEGTSFILTAQNPEAVSGNSIAVARAAEISVKSIASSVKYTNKTSGHSDTLANVAPVVKAQEPTPTPTPTPEKVLGLEPVWGWTVFGAIVAALLAGIIWMIAIIAKTKPKKK